MKYLLEFYVLVVALLAPVLTHFSMHKNTAIKCMLLSAVLFANYTNAQDLYSFTLNQMPLIMNPAFTGMFTGSLRVNTFYNREWYGVGKENIYSSAGASADMPVYVSKNNSYIAVGVQASRDGFPDYTHTAGSGSAAYHKIFVKPADSNRISDLSIGIRASFDRTKFTPGWNPYGSNSVHAGISYSHATGKRFNYTIGLSSFNLDDVLWSRDQQVKTVMQYVGELGANWVATERLTLRPAITMQANTVFNYFMAGNEFNYLISKGDNVKKPPTSAFAGIYYSSDKDILVNGGIKSGAFRFGAGYDFSVATVSNNYSAFRVLVQCQFGEQQTRKKQRIIPCNRF